MSLGTEQDGGDAGMITIKKPSRDIPGRHKNTKYIDSGLEPKHQSEGEVPQPRLIGTVFKEIVEIIFAINSKWAYTEPRKNAITELREIVIVFKFLFTQFLAFKSLRSLQ